MEINYDILIRREYVGIRRALKGRERAMYQRALLRGKRTIDALTSNGIDIDGTFILEQERKDFCDSDIIVDINPYLNAMETSQEGSGYDPIQVQKAKDEVGRKKFEKLGLKVKRLSKNPNRPMYKKVD